MQTATKLGSDRDARTQFYYFKPYDTDDCVYCGNPAECLDHFLPVIYAYVAAQFKESGVTFPLLPACNSCNLTASSSVQSTIRDRRQHVQKRLRKRFDSRLSAREWDADELAELAPSLRGYVRRKIIERENMWARITYTNPARIDEDRVWVPPELMAAIRTVL